MMITGEPNNSYNASWHTVTICCMKATEIQANKSLNAQID